MNKEVLRLFSKVKADFAGGEIRIEKWNRDGSATVVALDESGVVCADFSLRLVKFDLVGGLTAQFAEIRPSRYGRGRPRRILVSPIPSAILAVAHD
jgi:hypothetical protein